MTARMSVVIPAHDEAAVISRLLEALVADPRAAECEIVVVANGCTDATVRVARTFAPVVRVVEIEAASKIAALEAGDAAATAFPRAYVDADVLVDLPALLALADLLDEADGPLIASPRFEVDTAASSWGVQAHYRIWDLTDYRTRGHIGSGIYALSRAGRERFDSWPDVIADDRFVQQLFAHEERGTLDGHVFTVRGARTLGAHLRRSTRIARGNLELPDDRGLHADEPIGDRMANLIGRVARRPSLWPAFAVYCVTSTIPRMRAHRAIAGEAARDWARDDSSRVSA
ncbi:glycosyltransferase [Agromyces sp. NPDC058110]|uniref:glycosyltransferase n=1 Tax=Agromyces sp. NPDC058110 TaxID=3346345 RepID=UPI0036D8D12D